MSDDTPTRLLDAAEILFAEHGVEAVSFRQLAGLAKVNVAAAHYHFGSKPGLLEAVLLRRMGTLAERRSALIAECRQNGHAPGVADWVRVLMQPLLELIEREGPQGQAYVRLMWRCQTQDPAGIEQLARRHFGGTTTGLDRLLAEALPQVPQAQRHMRALLSSRLVFDVLAGGLPGKRELEQLRHFLCAGLCAGLYSGPAAGHA